LALCITTFLPLAAVLGVGLMAAVRTKRGLVIVVLVEHKLERFTW
jgi:hypothetical protein